MQTTNNIQLQTQFSSPNTLRVLPPQFPPPTQLLKKRFDSFNHLHDTHLFKSHPFAPLSHPSQFSYHCASAFSFQLPFQGQKPVNRMKKGFVSRVLTSTTSREQWRKDGTSRSPQRWRIDSVASNRIKLLPSKRSSHVSIRGFLSKVFLESGHCV